MNKLDNNKRLLYYEQLIGKTIVAIDVTESGGVMIVFSDGCWCVFKSEENWEVTMQ